jgi:IQ motif/SEC7 domain-containing protein
MLTGYYPRQQQQQMSLDGQKGSSSSNGNDVFHSSKTRPLTSSIYKTPTTTSVLISASSSRMFTSNSYEISDEISRANVQVLERKYGGRIRAHTAATRIQRAFRRFRLEQQFQNALRYPGPPGGRRRYQQQQQQMLPLPNDSSLNTFQLNGGDRQLYTRKLALSQPTLRYQPTVSLRAQLRVEQNSFDDPFSNQLSSPSSNSPIHNRSPPSPRPTEPILSKSRQGAYIEKMNSPRSFNPSLMSPRLIQRRTQMSDYPINAYSYSNNEMPCFRSHHIQPLPPAFSEVITKHRQFVSAGTSPSVWVPRKAKEDSPSQSQSQQQQQIDEPSKEVWKEDLNASRIEVSRPRKSANGHTNACYTNSLPRMDRRNHSLGPHTSSTNSGGFLSFETAPISIIMPPQEEQYRKRCYRIALNYFNKKPDRGLCLLIRFGFVQHDPHAVAEFFLVRRGLSRLMIGEFLGTLRSPFHASVLEAYLEGISMYNMEIDVALRHMLTYFRFPGEAQKVDHIIQAFARRYLECNPNRNIELDTIYVVAFAIIMLNTDLHTPSMKDSRRMKLEDFITNLRRVEGTEVFTDKMLTSIYERVKQREFRSNLDHVSQVMKVDEGLIGKGKPHLAEPHRRLICYCRLNQVLDLNRKQTPTDHNRELFLFNDLLIIAKTIKRKLAQYNLRYWTPLLGLKISTFQTQFYRYGIHLNCPDGAEFIFNAKNDDDRARFFNDIKETICEATEMESLRIELELDKQSNSLQRELIGSRLAHNHSGPVKVWEPTKKFDDFLDNENDNNSTLGSVFPPDSVTPTPSISVGKLSHNGVSTSSGCSASNASTASASSNSTPAPPNRRLSFNSLDSGVVEEAVDLSV